ncbi:MAG: META domain-containing protein [Muribaculaceae bacterium]|nr:META domain-containing protein [Muribaculaceae bacterium]
MKIGNNSVMIAALGMALTLSATGCSVFKPSSNREGSGKGLQGWVESEKLETAGEARKAKAEVTRGEKAAKAEAEKAMTKVDEKLQHISDVQIKESLSGDWAVETVLGKKAVGETAPFIKFVPGENRIYGNNGCNIINGSYSSDPASRTISFSRLAATMMLCGENNITDAEIGEALGLTVSYTLEKGNDDESILRFFDAGGRQVMELMHRDFHFLDGTWTVTAIDGEKVNIEGMKIALDVDEKRMHGNTGCNIINGELETDMDAANSISFSKIGMTRMACPDSGWETRMMVALEEAVTAKKVSADEIEFIGSNGKQVMLLRKTSPIDD